MKHVAAFFRRAFDQPEARLFTAVNDAMSALTLLSIFGIVMESVARLDTYQWLWQAIEYCTVFFFTLEYIGRIIAAPVKWRYIFSFFGFIDLLSIIPTYFGLTNLTFLKTARAFRILRFLRMARLAKVTRLRKNRRRDVEEYDHVYRLNLEIYIMALVIVVVVFGSLIHVFEAEQQPFANIPLGMLWAFKVVLGDVPHAEPTSALGQTILVVTRFAGLVLFGLLISVTGRTLQRMLLGGDQLSVSSNKKGRK